MKTKIFHNVPTHNKRIFVRTKMCAYYGRSAYYECAYYELAQYSSIC